MPQLRAGPAAVTTGTASLTRTFTIPSGAQVGDVIKIWAVMGVAAVTWSVTTGPAFTAQTATSATSGSMQLFERIMDGTEGWTPGTSTVTLTASASHPWSGIICAVGNENQLAPFDPPLSGSGQVNTASTTVTVAGVTTKNPGDLLIWLGEVNAASGQSLDAITVPAGFTAQVTQANSSGVSTSNTGVIMATKIQAAAGATGNANGSETNSRVNGGLLISVTDAQPAGEIADQAGYRPRWTPQYQRMITSRGRIFQPPCASQGTPFPLFTRQAGTRPRALAPLLRRSREFSPGCWRPLWNFPALGTPAQDRYFTVTNAQGAFITPGDVFRIYTVSGNVVIDAIDKQVTGFTTGGGFTNVFFAPFENQQINTTWFCTQVDEPPLFVFSAHVFTRQYRGLQARLALHRRYVQGRRAEPPWPQAPGGVPFPLFTRARGQAEARLFPARPSRSRQSGIIPAQVTFIPPLLFTRQPLRAKPGPKRGRLFLPGLPQGAQGAPFPLFTRQGGRAPRWAPPPGLARARHFEPGWGQVQVPGCPALVRQPGWRPRVLPLLRRGRLFMPPWPQASQGAPFPLRLAPPSWRPRWTPHRRYVQGRIFTPGWGQAGRGTPFPLWTRQPGYSPKWPPAPRRVKRRGQAFQPPLPQAPYQRPYNLFQPGSRPKWAPYPRRGRVFMPGWGQGSQGVPFPLFTRQAGWRPRWIPFTRQVRGRRFEPGWPQAAQGVPFPLIVRQPSWHPRWIPFTRLVRGRRFEPGWGQGNQGARFPLTVRQAGSRPRWLPYARLVKGRRAEPFFPQGTQGRSWPSVTRQAGWHPRWIPFTRQVKGRAALPPQPGLVPSGAILLSGTGTLAAGGTITTGGGAPLSAAGTMSAGGTVIKTAAALLDAAGTMTAFAFAGGAPADLWALYQQAQAAADRAETSWEETVIAGGTAGQAGTAYSSLYRLQLAASAAYAAWLAAYDAWVSAGTGGTGPG